MKFHFIFISLLYFFFSLSASSTLNAESNSNIAIVDCDIAGNISAEHLSCHGADDGILTLNLTGGTSPLTYLWSNGSTQEMLTALSPGFYTVTITDADDCDLELSVELTEPNFLFANVQTNTESSSGANDGSAIATPNGGTSPYTYQWNDANNSTDATIDDLAVGDYTVTVTDNNDCISIQTITINAFGCSITVINTISQITCIGECDGLSGALVGNGTPPYNYEWNTGSTSANLSGLCEGIYMVTVTDINGCNQQNEVIMLEPALLEVELVSVVNTGCFGNNDGIITVKGIGGKPPYTYEWSNEDEGSMIDSLSTGTYTVTVTGKGDCFAIMSIDVAQAPELGLSVEVSTPTDCTGGPTGVASVMATGGTGTYSFEWSNGDQGSMADSLAAGIHTVTVTDASNCTTEESFEIIQTGTLEVSLLDMGNTSCFGNADGFASIQAMGGANAYTYTWSNGSTGSIINGLAADIYEVTIVDIDNCTAEMSIEITQPPALTVSVITSDDVTCFGESNGALEVLAMGGTSAYNYLWSNGSTENNIDALSSGSYSMTITDANNCTEEVSFDITEPEVLELMVSETSNVTCFGMGNGSASIQATGGVNDYNYVWSNGTTGSLIQGIGADTYTVTATDANNCETQTSIEITSPTALLLSIENKENISCFGENDGLIEITPSGGVTPFIITWSNGDIGTSINELSSGDYTATLTDGNACTNEIIVNITAPTILELSIESISNVACGENSGAATVLATGGTGDYAYVWSNGMQTNEVLGLAASSYTVSVFDENDCFASVDIEILPGDDNEMPVVITQSIEIFLGEDGIAHLSADQVNNGSFDNCGIATKVVSDTVFDCSNLGINTVTLTITDLSGNIAQAEADITVTDNIAPQVMCPENITQEGCGVAVIYPFPILSDNCTIAGQFSLESGFLSGAVFPDGLTTVSYSYTDVGNNTATCSFDVTIMSVLSIDYTIEHVSCFGSTNGKISVFDTPNYTYNWENGSTASEIQDLIPGVYNLTVTDDQECEANLSFEILEPAPLGVTIEVITPEVNGDNNGMIDVTPTGGVAPYTFKWYLNDELFSEVGDLLGLISGDYLLTITDKNGCEFTSDLITVESITGINETQWESTINIFPNPASTVLSIHFTEKTGGEVKLQLFNAQGKLVITQTTVIEDRIELNIEHLKPGVYFLILNSQKGSGVKKILVE